MNDMILEKNDIYINLTDNLKFCNTTSFGASKKFITDYFLPEAKKTSDLDDLILERNMSRAVLKAVADGLILSNVPVYSHLRGFIGTNGKELKFNSHSLQILAVFIRRNFPANLIDYQDGT